MRLLLACCDRSSARLGRRRRPDVGTSESTGRTTTTLSDGTDDACESKLSFDLSSWSVTMDCGRRVRGRRGEDDEAVLLLFPVLSLSFIRVRLCSTMGTTTGEDCSLALP